MSRVASDRRKALTGLATFCGATAAVLVVGGTITATSVGTWYQTLAKPSFNPPDAVFAPVWTAIYAMMAVGGWLAWRGATAAAVRTTVQLYAVQLILNLGWTGLFFGLRAPTLALVEVLVLWMAIAACTYRYWRIDWRAGALFLPYLGWVSFAIALNAAIVALN